MHKKYLKTIKDIEALKDTDTKIYRENHTGYFKFVNGVLCFFNTDSAYIFYNVTMDFNQVESKLYIEVEDNPLEDDIGKLGWFFDYDKDDDGFIDVLDTIDVQPIGCDKYIPKANNCGYKHFRPLTSSEVEKYTGYKVVKENNYPQSEGGK